MNSILILAHGSQIKETEAIVDSLVEKVKKRTGSELVQAAYLQFSEQDLESGIRQLSDKGADSIKVVPMFIFDGVHVTQDIPGELEEIRARYPDIKINLSRHIGDDDRLADIITDRAASI